MNKTGADSKNYIFEMSKISFKTTELVLMDCKE